MFGKQTIFLDYIHKHLSHGRVRSDDDTIHCPYGIHNIQPTAYTWGSAVFVYKLT